jgi:hypothetical protein
LFKKGDIWRDSVEISRGGTSGRPLTFGAYGSDDTPSISRRSEVSNWINVPASPESEFEEFNISSWNKLFDSNKISSIDSYPVTGWEPDSDSGNGDEEIPVYLNLGNWSVIDHFISDTTLFADIDDQWPARHKDAWFRTVIRAGTFDRDDSRFRIRFTAGPEHAMKITGASVGFRNEDTSDFLSTPSTLTFNGQNSCIIPAGSSVWSDWTDVGCDSSRDYLIHTQTVSEGGNYCIGRTNRLYYDEGSYYRN